MSTLHPKIPANLYQTWHSAVLPPRMAAATEKIKAANPDFRYFLFDDADCRRFMEHFGAEALAAFDALQPGAYKADLWRYCVLYTFGGVYLDIKYEPAPGFKFASLLDRPHLVLDADHKGVYNALLVCPPKYPLIGRCIHQVLDNVKARFYGAGPLDPTGPHMIARLTSLNSPNIDLQHVYVKGVKYILQNNRVILVEYAAYNQEFAAEKKTDHYSTMWANKTVY